jgi:hypothetical protein
MFARSKLPNALVSPTTPNRGRVVKPLTDSTNMTWTRARLEKERNDWWDTQVTGSQEVWGAIRLAAQSLQLGKMREAQQWLEAMECTCPTGSLWKGVYDKTGVMYRVPEWLIVEPEGLVPEDAGDDAAGESAGAAGQDGAQEEDDEEDDEPVVVRARISRTGRDVVLKLQKKQTVASIIEKIKEQAEVRSCLTRTVKSSTTLFLNHRVTDVLVHGFITVRALLMIHSWTCHPTSASSTADASTKTTKPSSRICSGTTQTTTSSTCWCSSNLSVFQPLLIAYARVSRGTGHLH